MLVFQYSPTHFSLLPTGLYFIPLQFLLGVCWACLGKKPQLEACCSICQVTKYHHYCDNCFLVKAFEPFIYVNEVIL